MNKEIRRSNGSAAPGPQEKKLEQNRSPSLPTAGEGRKFVGIFLPTADIRKLRAAYQRSLRIRERLAEQKPY